MNLYFYMNRQLEESIKVSMLQNRGEGTEMITILISFSTKNRDSNKEHVIMIIFSYHSRQFII
jgi:hypothetical protein